MMKRMIRVCIAAVLALCMVGTMAYAQTHLYDKWNRYMEEDLWGVSYGTELRSLDDEPVFEPIEFNTYNTDDGVELGRLAMDFGDGNRSAADWIYVVAENYPDHCGEDSVLQYLAEQDIDEDGAAFLDSQLNAWKYAGTDTELLEEVYSLRVSIDGGAGVYEIMVYMSYEEDYMDWVESILVSHTGSGADHCTNEEAYQSGLPLKVVNCEEWVSLREEPSTSAARLAKVPLGAVINDWEEATDDFALCFYWEGESLNTGYILWDYLDYVD